MLVKLPARGSFELRKFFYSHGFLIMTHNTVTNIVTIDNNQSYEPNATELLLFDSQTVCFECIYNGEKPVDSEVIKKLMEMADVIPSFSFNKR